MRKYLVAATIWGAASAAHAADLPDLPVLRGSFTDGLSTSRTNWSGFYVGGQGDYGALTANIPPAVNADLQASYTSGTSNVYRWVDLGQAKGTTSGYGAFAGYNWQWDDVVLGIEGNYVHGGFHAASSSMRYNYDVGGILQSTTYSTASVRVDDFGSLRMRAGWTAGCFLPYAFIGGGVGSQVVDRSISANPAPVGYAFVTSSDHKSTRVYGYSAGLGVDVALFAGLFVRAEYEYQRVTTNIDSNINSVRAGLGYKF